MKATGPVRRPRSGDVYDAVLAAHIIANRDLYSPAWVESALRWWDEAIWLSEHTKQTIVLRHDSGGETTHKQIIYAEIVEPLLRGLKARTDFIESPSWAAPVMVLRLECSPHTGHVLLPLAVAHKVIDESVRAHLRKVTDTSPRGYHWEPRLPTEPLDESLGTGLRKINGRWEATNMPDEGAPALTDWFDEHEFLLKRARHRTLRAVYKALTSENPPKNWAQLASRVGQTEQWIRELAKREFDQQSAAQ